MLENRLDSATGGDVERVLAETDDIAKNAKE
jgi:hypothetical protein